MERTSPGWFIYGFVRKEAVLTSQIEGTQATLEDLLTHEAETPKKPAADHPAQEVCNYLDALGFAREQLLDSRGLPLSLSLLRSPLLYVSLYFKQHRSEYYRRLDAVRASGDWEGWNRFFLEGIATIASQAIESARDLYALYNEDRKRLLAQERTSVPALRLLEYLPVHPLLTVAQAMDLLQSTRPTTTKAISLLVDLGILEERSGRRRGRTYAYGPYLDRLSQGTELEG